MLWRLPAPVRSFVLAPAHSYSVTSHAKPTPGPLRILFCGSDEFSIASLRVLDAARRGLPGLIDSIHVVHRPPKRTGRGLKILKEVPIKHVATEELGLNTHVIDTFTGWTPPRPLDLVIAVSFGLFVPPRILALAKYGGLNLHPSLLPDLRGPAPIEHAILKGRSHTGVTVQTLDPTEFDRGIVLAQSPPPGCSISSTDKTASVEQTLSILGAEMLLDVLKSATFLTPMMDAGWYRTSAGPMDHAPKIVKQDRFIDFKTHTLADVQRIQRALGDPWCTLMNGDRLIIHEIAAEIDRRPDEGEPGIWVEKQPEYPLFRAACGTIGAIIRSTYAGHKAGHGNVKVLKLLKGMGT